MSAPMRMAYADPPYLGCCNLYGHHHEAPFGCWDAPSTHLQVHTVSNGNIRHDALAEQNDD